MNPNPDNSDPIPTPEASVPEAPAFAAEAPAPASAAPSLRPAAALRPATVPAPIAASTLKIPESRKFASPMPGIESSDDAVPVYITILAGLAAAASIAMAVLLYLKH